MSMILQGRKRRRARQVCRALAQIIAGDELRPRLDDVRLMLGLSRQPSVVEVEEKLEEVFLTQRSGGQKSEISQNGGGVSELNPNHPTTSKVQAGRDSGQPNSREENNGNDLLDSSCVTRG